MCEWGYHTKITAELKRYKRCNLQDYYSLVQSISQSFQHTLFLSLMKLRLQSSDSPNRAAIPLTCITSLIIKHTLIIMMEYLSCHCSAHPCCIPAATFLTYWYCSYRSVSSLGWTLISFVDKCRNTNIVHILHLKDDYVFWVFFFFWCVQMESSVSSVDMLVVC